jgi:hypothetical protein
MPISPKRPDHVLEVLHGLPGSQRGKQTRECRIEAGSRSAAIAQVVEATTALGGDGVEVLLGGNVVAAPRAPPVTVLGGDP